MVRIPSIIFLLCITSYAWSTEHLTDPLIQPPRMRHAHLTPETTRIKSAYEDLIRQTGMTPTLRDIHVAEWQGLLPSHVHLIAAIQNTLTAHYPTQEAPISYFFWIITARLQSNNSAIENISIPEHLQPTGGNQQ